MRVKGCYRSLSVSGNWGLSRAVFPKCLFCGPTLKNVKCFHPMFYDAVLIGLDGGR